MMCDSPYDDRISEADTECLCKGCKRLDGEVGRDDTVASVDPCIEESIDKSTRSTMHYSPHYDRLTETNAECLGRISPGFDGEVGSDDTIAAIDAGIEECIDESTGSIVDDCTHCD